jgi:NADP-dependent 3-hydroxy acid dehydrogenase YdfG
MTQIAIVTGSSSGIGHETSLVLASNGIDTYATMRNLDKSNGIIHKAKEESLTKAKVTQVDIINDNSVRAAIEKIISEKGRIDVLVNSAGYGLFGSLEYQIMLQTGWIFCDTRAVAALQKATEIERRCDGIPKGLVNSKRT